MLEAGLAKVKRDYLNGLPRREQFRLLRAESKGRQQKLSLWKEPAE
jgi:endonuclease YncB( thermonuclease family)